MNQFKTKNPSKRGFTLVELIIVVAIISILGAALFVAIDPARRLNESRNARRWSDITNILDALITYQADNDGVHLTAVSNLAPGTYYTIGTCATGGDSGCGAQTTAAACANLSTLPTNYLASVPQDPTTGTAAETDYYISRAVNGTLIIGACDSEGEGAGGAGGSPAIQLSR
jgi:prepilin-type N-terminal cleavage/methylation domain-containing protein